ncbi:MAG: hypothetical protein KAT00_04750 [Planctomycetes bacterium]|nr:hypothetical protein [Planctomycetota bacterium]
MPKSPKNSKIRLRSELRHGRTAFLHDDALKAYNRLGEKFSDGYKRPRWTMMNIAIQLLDKTVKERGLKAGDDLEAILGV